jgi:hypothetical protein
LHKRPKLAPPTQQKPHSNTTNDSQHHLPAAMGGRGLEGRSGCWMAVFIRVSARKTGNKFAQTPTARATNATKVAEAEQQHARNTTYRLLWSVEAWKRAVGLAERGVGFIQEPTERRTCCRGLALNSAGPPHAASAARATGAVWWVGAVCNARDANIKKHEHANQGPAGPAAQRPHRKGTWFHTSVQPIA